MAPLIEKPVYKPEERGFDPGSGYKLQLLVEINVIYKNNCVDE